MPQEPIGEIAKNLAHLAENIAPASNQLTAIIAAPILTAIGALVAAYIFNRLSYWHQKKERRRLLAAAIAAELEGWDTICTARDYDAYGQSLLQTLAGGTDIEMPRLIDPSLSTAQTASLNFPIIHRNIDDIGIFGSEITSEVSRFLSLHQGLTADLIAYAQGRWDHVGISEKIDSISVNLGLFRQCVSLARGLIPKFKAIAF
ncbi:MAG: hypothetical protein RIA64_16000 [Rhodospirillales bacterium]